MATAGPNAPGTTGNDASVGTGIWLNTDNIKVLDSTYSEVTLATGSSQFLTASNFGFAIPAGSTILGIEFNIWWFEASGAVEDETVKVIKGGTISGNNLSKATELDGSITVPWTYGGPTELWGLSWTPADINASNFGIGFSVLKTHGTGKGDADYVTATIYYDPPASNADNMFIVF